MTDEDRARERLAAAGCIEGFRPDQLDEPAIIAPRAVLAALTAAEEGIVVLRRERDNARAKLTVPGLWRCAKCGFVLVQSNLNARDGTVTTRDDAGDRCPNDGAPLWRMSWQDRALDAERTCETQVERALAAEHERDEARADARIWMHEAEQRSETAITFNLDRCALGVEVSQLKEKLAAAEADTRRCREALGEFVAWLDRADDPADDCDYLNEDGWDDVRAIALRARALLTPESDGGRG